MLLYESEEETRLRGSLTGNVENEPIRQQLIRFKIEGPCFIR